MRREPVNDFLRIWNSSRFSSAPHSFSDQIVAEDFAVLNQEKYSPKRAQKVFYGSNMVDIGPKKG